MRYLRYLALLGILMLPVAYSQAQVAVGVRVGPGYVGPAPVCAYGYYSYYPYACAPYGYYGPQWFVGGVFIGAGPWYHGYTVGLGLQAGLGLSGWLGLRLAELRTGVERLLRSRLLQARCLRIQSRWRSWLWRWLRARLSRRRWLPWWWRAPLNGSSEIAENGWQRMLSAVLLSGGREAVYACRTELRRQR